MHRHEPPITNEKIELLHKDEERQFIVISKPGSVVSLSRPVSHLPPVSRSVG